MAVDRTHVGEAQLFKHRTNLGHSKAPHAALESIEFSWYFASHEGKIPNAFLNTSGEELHRGAESHPVEMR